MLNVNKSVQIAKISPFSSPVNIIKRGRQPRPERMKKWKEMKKAIPPVWWRIAPRVRMLPSTVCPSATPMCRYSTSV